ncbi:hypothetical protein [Bradyrhizobium sp. Leo170]|uniref:hypothetical protein n=1 Tax=Bradyrhizobium sp. Leo170 TaxID=1571199 RepID=UPI00102EBD2E|nr:hypothetical protein [Bradyrhizobium sp. Leo170]TAI61587.1 hypothetical protein CWO89_34355 [Bradyrhizobium sp. Leo170]
MADTETLLIKEGKRPETATGSVGVVMLLASSQGEDSQWFDYRPGFYQDIVRVEWDKDTMQVVLPADVSDYLTRNGYARIMTNKEARAYNNGLGKAGADPAQTPPQQPAETPQQERKSP